MLEIASIKWRNFLSYGDYETSIDRLDQLGPVLITGEIVDGDSNGAGKSTITTAILWALFGRVFNKDKPGDNVINWFTGGGCYVELRTVDGWIIKRTRKLKGHDDLLVYDSSGADQTRSTNEAAQKFINRKFGLDYKLFISSTFFGQLAKSFLETSDAARKEILEHLLGLDRINAWAEVAKEKLRAIESRNDTVKAAVVAADRDIEKYRQIAATNAANDKQFEITRQTRLDELSNEIARIEEAISTWDLNVRPKLDSYQLMHDKLQKLQQARTQILDQLAELRPKVAQHKRDSANLEGEIAKLKARRDELATIDFVAQRQQHSINAELTLAHASLTTRINELALKVRAKKQDAARAAGVVKEWNDKAGTACPTCKQAIDNTHVADLCKPYRDEAKRLLGEISELESAHSKLVSERSAITIVNIEYSVVELNRMENEYKGIDVKIVGYEQQIASNTTNISTITSQIDKLAAQDQRIQTALADNRPPMSIADIESSRRANEDNHKRHRMVALDIQAKNAEQNPYKNAAAELESTISALIADKTAAEVEIAEITVTASHYLYLWKSYSERSKVKRLILSKLIPYLNERIKYYLDCFGCDIVLSFKDNLSVESNIWGYDWCSGGERKRIDLALMFALYDLYLGIHGRQCNIMVLDEVDGRLDGTGIDALINIISNDFTKDQPGRVKPGTIFVISHRPEMLDAFPTKILVKRDDNRMSHIVDIV